MTAIDRDRGQLIVLVALAIAVLFVSLALILNSVIYTENLATRDTGGESRSALITQASVADAVGENIDAVNRQVVTTHDHEAVHSSFEAMMAGWRTTVTRSNARDGRFVDVELTSQTEGTAIRQDETRNFTAGGTSPATPIGRSPWT